MPGKPRKFGTFAGVFTPSILTILGVIMYMRLGWVIGQTGLINALIIIFIAHVISISTGLSISSIATDKKIKAGGIYYILSRSLGLPMGGAIGIALFIGTALSISLYLVGFAENVLGIEPIRGFLGLEQDVTGYRIVGTAAIIILVVLAFISTSLAIKAQFYIMGAIALSIISIIVGLWINNDFLPEQASLFDAETGVSPILVFAIFFPAVTGFTAGVAMSGDLKDPKKSIPVGTLAAIAAGLVVYVGLAIIFAFFVDRELLLTDKNFLLRIAWFSPFVIAGVWGATLSSALGGILGGPRILQAISADRITPRLLAKTYGKNNEPRMALLFIFLIAEAGILIGKLDVIAGIVSMFYLASYGFINLAFFLEKWASTDFRPSFRVNRYVGLIGFIAAFGVMFQLDMISMFAALIIMWGLFFFLQKKKLSVDYGDVWQSVYSSVVRTALHRMDRKEEDERNWQPNVILFSGGTKKRPHLIEFGKCIVGKHGVLSNFDLIENKSARVLFPKRKQSFQDPNNEFGIFSRRKTVKDIYQGIETISAIYGFSGFEPNTVLLGWARQTRNPERFTETLNNLYNLDLNILLLDYDERVGFGSYKTIDIWWRDVSNQGNLALTISKLIVLSPQWQNAEIRLLIINSKNDLRDNILNRAEKLLDNMRINASVRVIHNEIERRSMYDLMLTESNASDLIIFGIPQIIRGKETEFVEMTNQLLHKIGTVLMIRASSTFKKLSLGLEKEQTKPSGEAIVPTPKLSTEVSTLKFPSKPKLADEFRRHFETFEKIIHDFHSEFVIPSISLQFNKTRTIESIVDTTLTAIEKNRLTMLDGPKKNRLVSSLKNNLLIRSINTLNEARDTLLQEQKDQLSKGVAYFNKRMVNTLSLLPAKITISLHFSDLQEDITDPLNTRSFKKLKRRFNSKARLSKGIPYNLRLRKLAGAHLPNEIFSALLSSLEELGILYITYMLDLQKLINTFSKNLDMVEISSTNYFTEQKFANLKKEIDSILNDLHEKESKARQIIYERLYGSLVKVFVRMTEVSEKIPANSYIGSARAKNNYRLQEQLAEAPGQILEKMQLLYNSTMIDQQLLLLKYRLYRVIIQAVADFRKIIEESIYNRLSDVHQYIREYVGLLSKSKKLEFKIPEEINSLPDLHKLKMLIDKITDTAYRNIKGIVNRLPVNIELLSVDSLNNLTNLIFDEVDSAKISTFQLVDYYVQNNLLEPLVNLSSTLPEEINKSATQIKEATRRISFGEGREDPIAEVSETIYDIDSFSAFAREQLNMIEANLEGIKSTLQKTEDKLLTQYQTITERLSIYHLLKNPEKYRRYVNKAEGKIKGSKAKLLYGRIGSKLQNFKANIWYKQSEALIFARKMSEEQKTGLSVIDSLLTIREQVTPNHSVLKKLPFYYEQLFLRKYNYQPEFWFGRKAQLEEIEKTIRRFDSGHAGAILISGERNSGKTFLANYIAANHFKNKQVYYINTQPAGSSKTDEFVRNLQDATGIKGQPDQIFSELPDRSFFIIDNLELWWEKSSQGADVIRLIRDMIGKYGHRFLFMVTVNRLSFRVINQMLPINPYFLNIIDLPPLNAQELQKIIMFRHNSSGFNLRLAKKPNQVLHNSDLAKLFSRHFSVSNGNVGDALLSWITNITDFSDNTVLIKSPQSPDLAAMEILPPAMRLYLSQFIIHKRLNNEKMHRITFDHQKEIESNISFLKRLGLITETAGQIYELNKYLHPHIRNKLFEKNK